MKMQYQLLKRFSLLAFFFLFITGSLMAQENLKVSGKVTDAKDGTPLVGVTVSVKGTQQASITNYDGTFNVQTSRTATLTFSYIGYASQDIPVNGNVKINVALVPTASVLGEVVVVGYGTVRKTDATGAISAIGSKDFNKGAITSPQELLVGKSSGVVITTNGGAPGGGATIRIRGGSSLNASNDPLIVIDGVAIDNTGVSGMGNSLNTINPNDIESFTVLKDASSTAIYGSRASNGVIIITTKKGKEGKMELNYNGNVSMGQAPKFVDVFTGDQYRALSQQLLASHLSGLSANALKRLGTANTDWQKEIYRTAISHDHNLSASGTYLNTPYRVSVGFTDNNGILKTTNLTRNTLALSLDPTFFQNHLKVSLSLKGVYSKENFGNTGAIGAATSFDPTQVVRNNNTAWGGYFTWVDMTANLPNGSMDPNGHPNGIGPSNPVALLNQTDNKSTAYRSIGNLNLDYKFHFLPELSAKLNLGYDYSDSKGHNNQPANAAWTVRGGTGYFDDYSFKGKTQLLNFNLQYIKEVPSIKSKFDVLAGYEWSHFWLQSKDWNRSTTTTNDPTTYPTEHFLVSFLGRLNYTLMDKYLLTVTLRDDNSSRFAANNREGLFPSAALAWKIKQESFLKNVSAISELKLRLGYGVTGQENIGGNYPYLPVYNLSTSTAQYQFGSGFYSTLRPNPYDANIKWESTITQNIGLDFGFFKDRVTGSIDAYNRKTNDLLATIPVAAGSNFSNYLFTNVGNLTNKGIEASVNVQVIAKKDLFWTVGANFSYNENQLTKILKIDDPKFPGIPWGNNISGGVGNQVQNVNIGYAVNSFYVFQQVYGQNGMPIEGLYVDRSGLGGVVTSQESNKYHYKKPAPDQTIGLTSRLTYQKFDFSFSARANIGNYVYNNFASAQANYSSFYNQSGFFNNLPRFVKDAPFMNPQYFSDIYVENASFFRMDNMSAGYNFGEILGQKLKARLSFTVQNAFVITNYKGLDPEVSGGIDNNIYPRPRVFLLGVNLTF
jgi:TonB-linked SusC/RagA family outer membrane protein